MQTQGALLAEYQSGPVETSQEVGAVEETRASGGTGCRRSRENLASSPHKKPSAHKANYQLKDSNAHVCFINWLFQQFIYDRPPTEGVSKIQQTLLC